MACITRCILRWGLIGGLALGGATLLIGPERVMGGLAQIQSKAQVIVDDFVDDPIALRRQLEELSEQYPNRIAEVRGEIAEVNHQLGQFDRDVEIAKRVVAMTTDDLKQLKTLVAQAEARQAASARNVVFHFEGVRFNVEQAYTEAGRINHVRNTYKDRLAHDNQQHEFLSEQKDRLMEILNSLETDYSTYQAQLWQLDRQIDAIERNERLIELTKDQQATLAGYDKFKSVGSLRQLQAKLAELRTIQEAQLETMSKHGIHGNYEKMAEADLDMSDLGDNPFADIFIDFEDEAQDTEDTDAGSVAYSG
jgi:chromosome segregation ATPase